MQYAFHPERVCGSVADRAGCEGGRCGKQRRSGRVAVYAPLAADWSRSACGSRRYLLPGLAGNVQGHWDYRKEWFFYGGGGAAWPKGWEDYAGVELPLCYWEREYQRLLRVRPLADTLAHSRALCSSAQPSGEKPWWQRGPRGGGPCTHRACLPLDMRKIRFGPEFDGEYDRETSPRWQVQATKALPRLDPSEHPGAVVPDFTPNYLCSVKSLRNLRLSVGAPRHWRLLLVMRTPLDALTSSYKMFVQWGWVRSANLSSDVMPQLRRLRRCNPRLYDSPELLGSLSDEQVLRYFESCWGDGVWRNFVTNSLHYVCLRAWIAAGFSREQLLLLSSEKLRTLQAHELVDALANFTGLHHNAPLLATRREELNAQCEAPDSAANRAAWLRRRQRSKSSKAPLVNTHRDFNGSNAQVRSRLDTNALAEFTRLADAHEALLAGLGLREV